VGHEHPERDWTAGRPVPVPHETLTDGAVSVTDLKTGETRVLVQRVDWHRMDGIVWTPWRTLLTAEEMRPEPVIGPGTRARGQTLASCIRPSGDGRPLTGLRVPVQPEDRKITDEDESQRFFQKRDSAKAMTATATPARASTL
jgi:hypothetical protein